MRPKEPHRYFACGNGHPGQCWCGQQPEHVIHVSRTMMTAEARLAEIRERLGAATPRPWDDDGCCMWAENGTVKVLVRHHVFGLPTQPDAAFIAHAPEDVGWLLVHIEELKCALGKADPQRYRCTKPKGWLCGFGYGHDGPCGSVAYRHVGSD